MRTVWFNQKLVSTLLVFTLCAFEMTAAFGEGLQDAQGGTDHPAISRFKGATLLAQTETPFESVIVGLGPITTFDNARARLVMTKEQVVEGHVSRHMYLAPANTTALEVVRNYTDALSRGGFTKLYSCGPADCGGGATHALLYQDTMPREERLVHGSALFHANTSFYVVARGGTAHAPLWALVMVGTYQHSEQSENGRAAVYQMIIQPKETSLGNVTTDADAMAKAIEEAGKVALYGLYFDTGSDKLKSESKPQLAEVAKFLQANPKLAVIVVGHTDNQGAFDFNIQLSERRAAAVVKSLTNEHGIDVKRLGAKGVGMVAPVASNRNEAGRAKNRRVEIVER